MPRLTKERLEEIRERAEKATDSPWYCDDTENNWHLYGWFENDPEHKMHPKKILRAPKGTLNYWPDKNDEALIVNAREDILALIAELTAREQEIAELETEIGEMTHAHREEIKALKEEANKAIDIECDNAKYEGYLEGKYDQ